MWWLTVLGRLSSSLAKWQTKLADAKTEQQRIHAQAQVDRLSLKVQAQVNGEWTKLPKIVRGLWAAPYIIFTWKVVVIDKVFKAGVTDPLSDHDAKVMLMILAFYFVYDLGSSVAGFFSKNSSYK